MNKFKRYFDLKNNKFKNIKKIIIDCLKFVFFRRDWLIFRFLSAKIADFVWKKYVMKPNFLTNLKKRKTNQIKKKFMKIFIFQIASIIHNINQVQFYDFSNFDCSFNVWFMKFKSKDFHLLIEKNNNFDLFHFFWSHNNCSAHLFLWSLIFHVNSILIRVFFFWSKLNISSK